MKNVILTIVLTIISFGVETSVAMESSYTIPDELKPMSTWRNGWTADETLKYRQEYNNTLTGGKDDGDYAITHTLFPQDRPEAPQYPVVERTKIRQVPGCAKAAPPAAEIQVEMGDDLPHTYIQFRKMS